MKAADVMVAKVVTADRDTPVHEIANLLVTHRISAVPVVDKDGTLAGIVSEGDLLHRVETGTAHTYPWWSRLFSDKEMVARDYLKSHGLRASDVMTKRVIVAPPDMPLGELAALLERHGIKRVPVVDGAGQLVGIVSRADLVRTLARLRPNLPVKPNLADACLRDLITSEIRAHALAGVSQLNVVVHEGVVELWGQADSAAERDALRVAAEIIPGVRQVEDHIAIGVPRYF